MISDGIDLLGVNEDFTAEGKKLEPPAKKVTPEEFLGPNAKLVDFDDLISKPTTASEFFEFYSVSLPAVSLLSSSVVD